ncbi:AlwI family type II restriction endonuclease [Heyndrickxia sporothermodurans]|nr:AlwI family type II restriction endonuclease [Heyndrickxia sporothermodurans]
MKVGGRKQVFNLMDTNGRRSDVVNAYTIYMEILDELFENTDDKVWASYPQSRMQFDFYRQAIERSPETFKRHPKYDGFVKVVSSDSILNALFKERDIEKINKHPKGKRLLKVLDNGIEDRARHYTSNLVKVGFTFPNRNITPVGKAFVQGKNILRGNFEELLPINQTNLIFLRQLLKLRVYTKDYDRFYSPMMMCLLALLMYERIDTSILRTMVQMITPYETVNARDFINQVITTSVAEVERRYISFEDEDDFQEVKNQPVPMDKTFFETKFKNRKSNKVPEYYEFYLCLVSFLQNKNTKTLESLRKVAQHNDKRVKINQAFGYNSNVFKWNSRKKDNVTVFLEENQDSPLLNSDRINEMFYLEFQGSKRHDSTREYGDTFIRLLRATGIVHMKQGIAELANRDLWLKLVDVSDVAELVFGECTTDEGQEYGNGMNSPFFNHLSVENILGIYSPDIEKTVEKINVDLGVTNSKQAKELLKSKTRDAFVQHIHENYPIKRTLELLRMFSDRSNDDAIQKQVDSEASIPTIFEYIVGIAWYHISTEEYDVFSSFNLTMNADFIPETHAGGGDGDIIVRYNDSIIMLEVTLMNKQAQKRGEWEPVLRHATNLTIEESEKDVTTLFIADELDENTINIWRAVASVPLKSSRGEEYTDLVTIMPLENKELANMLEKGVDDKAFIQEVRESFAEYASEFNLGWRSEIMDKF